MANSFFLNHTALYYYFFYSCIYLFLAMLGLPCCVGFSLIAVHGLFLAVASLLEEHRLWNTWAQSLWQTHWVAPRHMESSQIRDQTCISCIGRQILYHWATREAPECWVLSQLFHSPLSPSSRGSLVPLHIQLLEWYHLYIWDCWYFSWKS